jgi:2-amino-4-hydroxy-6-hydroxymethyldihydropteridine diphosphokinase
MIQESLIALGSNLGSDAGGNAATLCAALRDLVDQGVTVRRVSRFFSTPCFPPGAGPDYVNACAAIRSDATPEALMSQLHDIEARFGRERTQRWASRTLDLDLLAYGDQILPTAEVQMHWQRLTPDQQQQVAPDQLILPHPRLQERGFVLHPLVDIAAGWRHPTLGLSVAQMRDALPPEALDGICPL